MSWIMKMWGVLSICGLLSAPVWGDSSVNINIKGNLITNPPCDVYGDDGKGAPIRVRFDEVGIQRIDGVRFRQDWTLTVSCDETLGTNAAIELLYSGTPSLFDGKALFTDKDGLGIRLYQKDGSGEPVGLNTPLTLKMPSNGEQKIFFYSVPVKDPKGALTAGKFTASATLALNYP